MHQFVSIGLSYLSITGAIAARSSGTARTTDSFTAFHDPIYLFLKLCVVVCLFVHLSVSDNSPRFFTYKLVGHGCLITYFISFRKEGFQRINNPFPCS